MLMKLYQKSQLRFALVWIAAYVVLMSVANGVSEALGVANSVNAVVAVGLFAVLWGWLRANQLSAVHGFRASRVSASKLLYYLPLVAMSTTNLWFGVSMNYPPLETACAVVAMLAVGFLEELLFRGLLFNALRQQSLGSAIIISSVTFGLGHLVNLLNGNSEGLFKSVLQVGYAISLGLLFTVLYWRTGSLWACIASHAAIDVLSVFANQAAQTPQRDIAGAVFLIVGSLAYAAYIWKRVPPVEDDAA